MIRNDFVSNSSSSSFIVCAEDNKNGLLWDRLDDISVMDFKEVIDSMYSDWSLGYVLDCIKDCTKDIKFVPDKDYSKHFRDFRRIDAFPESCRGKVESYVMYYKEYLNMKNDNCKASDFEENVDRRNKIIKWIRDKVYNVLKKEWDDVKFHSITINDYYVEDMYDIFECEDSVELFKNKIFEIKQIKELKFYYSYGH